MNFCTSVCHTRATFKPCDNDTIIYVKFARVETLVTAGKSLENKLIYRAMCTSYRVLKNQGLKFLTHHQMTISYKVNGSLDLS